MIKRIEIYFLLFIIYSVLGWTMEVIGKLVEERKFVNRGFLIGPWCSIYGVGAILITLLLKNFTYNVFILFIMSILVCGILEYLTSYFMEKIFKARWWDYSKKKFHINGRVCLDTIIPFGLLGCFIVYLANPFFIELIEKIPNNILNIISIAILVLYVIDNCISFGVIINLRNTTKLVNRQNRTDNTEEITKKVKEILFNKSIFDRRLLNAYPKLTAIKEKIKERTEEIKESIEETKEEIKESIKETKKEIKENIQETKEEIRETIEQTKENIKKITKRDNQDK